MKTRKRTRHTARAFVPLVRDADEYSLTLTVIWNSLADKRSYEWYHAQYAQRELDKRKRRG